MIYRTLYANLIVSFIDGSLYTTTALQSSIYEKECFFIHLLLLNIACTYKHTCKNEKGRTMAYEFDSMVSLPNSSTSVPCHKALRFSRKH